MMRPMFNHPPSANKSSAKHAISVSELNRQARTLLERSFLMIHVEGEISNFVRPSSGHWYFTLKDGKAQVRCAMFKNRNQLIKPTPKDGDKVVVRAKVSLYEGRGEYQLICEFLEPAGNGALQAAFDELKLKLQQEGLFETQHKKPIPKHPRHIGVVTSPTGAAIHDILTVLKRRFPGLPVTLYPTSVQGDDAPQQICKSIILAEAHRECDLLIIGRGGGSQEDLWAFNNELVARTIFNCEIPVISAVGHEVDVVISDFVADVRAATPSAAAEMVSPDQHQLRLRLNQLNQRLTSQLRGSLLQAANKLSLLKNRLRHPRQNIKEQAQRLDNLELRLNSSIRRELEQQQHLQHQLSNRLQAQFPAQLLLRKEERLQSLKLRLKQAEQTLLQQKQFKFKALMAQLNTVSPLATLERGYAIVKDSEGKVIMNASSQQTGNTIETQLYRGRLRCSIDEIIEE